METRPPDLPARCSRRSPAAAPRGAGSPGRPDRRALRPPRGGDRPPAHAHPRVRRPRGLGHGFRSCAEWLAWRVSLDLGAARERVRVARALGTLPALAEALARGELSYAKVRALTRIATPETEARLLAVGRAGTAAHVESIVRGWRRLDRQAEAREATRQHAGRALHVYQDEDGTVVLRGRLTPEAGALLLRALDAGPRDAVPAAPRHRSRPPATDPATETPTRPQQQADALALLAETALHHELDPGAPGERYQVVVHVDAAVLADAAQPGQSVLEERPARSRGNVAAAGVRREPGRDAARRGRAGGGSRGPNADDPAGATAGAAASGQELPLPGLQGPGRRGASRAPLGPRRPDEAVESRVTLSPPSPRGARGGLPGSTEGPTAHSSSDDRMAGRCPTYQRRPRCPPIRPERSGHRTPRRGSIFMRARGSPSGSGSGWTWAGRSTCCIRGRREPPMEFVARRTRVVRGLRCPRRDDSTPLAPGSACSVRPEPSGEGAHQKRMTLLVRLLAGAAMIAGLAACDRSPQVSAGPKPPGVTVVAVAQRSVPVYGQYVGQTEAVKTVEVRARVEGFIERQVAPDGADVKAGDLLFVIDPRPFEAALRQAEANVARDTAGSARRRRRSPSARPTCGRRRPTSTRDLAQVENAQHAGGALPHAAPARADRPGAVRPDPDQHDRARGHRAGRPRRSRERAGRARRVPGGHRERAGRGPRRRGRGRHRAAAARVHVDQVAARRAHGPGRGPGGRPRRARATPRSSPSCPRSIRCTSTSA